MLAFMDYIQNAFFAETNWNRDNSYGSLTDTARGKKTPRFFHAVQKPSRLTLSPPFRI